MIPIVETSKKAFTEDSFKIFLLEMTKQHKKEGRALAFAFLVYDFEDHTIQKIIKDPEYWTALDKISAHYLSIFYINSQNKYYTKRQKQNYEIEKKAQERSMRKGYLSMMIPATMKDTPLDRAILYIKRIFNLEEKLKHPFILFFQTDGDNITDSFALELKEEKLEDAFLELKKQIVSAVKSVEEVKIEYSGNHQEVFNLIRSGVKSGVLWNFIKSKVFPKIGIDAVTSFVQLIAGRDVL